MKCELWPREDMGLSDSDCNSTNRSRCIVVRELSPPIGQKIMIVALFVIPSHFGLMINTLAENFTQQVSSQIEKNIFALC